MIPQEPLDADVLHHPKACPVEPEQEGSGPERWQVLRAERDQLIPYLALADGISEITSTELTSHALTNIMLVEQILDAKFEVEGEQGQVGRIRVKGRVLPEKIAYL